MRLYEEPSKRAARYSKIAEDQLSQTRTTLGAACVGVRPLTTHFRSSLIR